MNAFITIVSNTLKENGYVFNELRKIPQPRDNNYVLVEKIRTWDILVTKTDHKEQFTLVQIGWSYYKLIQ